ncbi:hypothetical protein HPS54_08560 [Prevotella sp. PCHR]|uniref:Uncharacterized protein n=1 Tax=Xylanibacter caecicola TaxID=2736294 RepID=A0ABX2B3I7_9BACT|nr:hypothetical protein [Xylanibacter caecicola]NPE25562.1 hypothetical protein [Xylanibacter caecicola]
MNKEIEEDRRRYVAAPQKIKDNSFEISNRTFVFYLPLSSFISSYLLMPPPLISLF